MLACTPCTARRRRSRATKLRSRVHLVWSFLRALCDLEYSFSPSSSFACFTLTDEEECVRVWRSSNCVKWAERSFTYWCHKPFFLDFPHFILHAPKRKKETKTTIKKAVFNLRRKEKKCWWRFALPKRGQQLLLKKDAFFFCFPRGPFLPLRPFMSQLYLLILTTFSRTRCLWRKLNLHVFFFFVLLPRVSCYVWTPSNLPPFFFLLDFRLFLIPLFFCRLHFFFFLYISAFHSLTVTATTTTLGKLHRAQRVRYIFFFSVAIQRTLVSLTRARLFRHTNEKERGGRRIKKKKKPERVSRVSNRAAFIYASQWSQNFILFLFFFFLFMWGGKKRKEERRSCIKWRA